MRYNCAAVVAGGKVRGLIPKQKLPTYNIFYEGRTYSRGHTGQAELHRGVPLGDYVFRFDFGVLGTEVCEDIWSPDGPQRRRTYSGAELVVNLSASPFRIGVVQTRKEMIGTRASDHQCVVAYTNAVGSNDGLIFDGGGFVNQNGKWMMEAPRFTEGYTSTTVDLDRTARLRSENTTWRLDREEYLEDKGQCPILEVPESEFTTQRTGLSYPVPKHKSFFLPGPDERRSFREDLCEDVLDALSLGIGDYFEKTRGFKSIGIALSGGRDSLLTLLIAHRYARRVRPNDPGSLIHCFYMPARYSSEHTKGAAATIAKELGCSFKVVSIDDAFERELGAVKQMLGDAAVTPVTEQNIQARLRAQRMWNWANSSGGLFLQTGNMSEKAVGYTTIGGDLMGALAVIANVPKTLVMYLLDYLYEKHKYQGIQEVIAKPAGPELAPNQKGEDDLMPFPVLDACFYLFAGEKLLPAEVHQALVTMFPEQPADVLKGHVDKFSRLFMQSIYKWVQSPLSLHVGNLDLERERALQIPVVTNSNWSK
jgi:NAD+ synthase (glutamine-hydrolysing)